MSSHKEDLGIPRINDDVIYKQSRPIEIVEQMPRARAIRRCINLAVERPKIKSISVRRIDYQRTDVAAARSGQPPIAGICCSFGATARRQTVSMGRNLEGCLCQDSAKKE